MYKRNQFLDVAKGVCILMVVITHYSWSKQERINYFFPYWISMAVPIFMIITGYVSTASYERKGIHHFGETYEPVGLLKKYIRYSVPFFITFGIQIILEHLLYHNVTLDRITEYVFKGGFGKYGTYYYPILLQMIVLFPIIYYTIKKFKGGLIYCFFFNIAFEVIQNLIEMKRTDYRLLVFRYIYIISFGCYLYLRGQKKIKKWYPFLFIIGVSYIMLISYTSYKPQLFTYWKNTSALATMYVIPIFGFLMEYYNKKSELFEKNIITKTLAFIGTASYNIFFIQILYYNYFNKMVGKFISHDIIHVLINLILCLIFGIGFYYLETPLTKKLIKQTDILIAKLKKL